MIYETENNDDFKEAINKAIKNNCRKMIFNDSLYSIELVIKKIGDFSCNIEESKKNEPIQTETEDSSLNKEIKVSKGSKLNTRLIGQILRDLKVMTLSGIDEVLKIQDIEKESGVYRKFGEIAIELSSISYRELAEALSIKFSCDFIDLSIPISIPKKVIALVGKEIIFENQILPISQDEEHITIAVSDPTDLYMLDNLRFITNCKIKVVIAAKNEIEDKIAEYYGFFDSCMCGDDFYSGELIG